MISKAKPPTKVEADRIAAIKEGPCIACWLNDTITLGCDAHHLLSGGIRRGHRFTIALCQWHHRGMPMHDLSHRDMRASFGPALSEGSKPFRHEFGTDELLLRVQDELLKERSPDVYRAIEIEDQRSLEA